MVLFVLVIGWVCLGFGMEQLFDPDDFGWLAALLYMVAGLAVAVVGYATSLRGWLQKALWLLAMLATIAGVPLALQTAAEFSGYLPASFGEMYVLVAAIAAPVGVIVGVYRAWLS